MKYFETEEIISLNRSVLFPGEEHLVKDRGGVESAIHRHKQYEDIFDVASAILHSFAISGQLFLQGNKRTGGLAMRIVLASDGYDFSMPKERLAKKIYNMADKRWDRVKIRSWLKRHTRKIA